jgi:hypothetical protein
MIKYAKFRFDKNSIIFWFLDFLTEHLFTSRGTPLFRGTRRNLIFAAWAVPWYGFVYYRYIEISFVIYLRIKFASDPCDLSRSKLHRIGTLANESCNRFCIWGEDVSGACPFIARTATTPIGHRRLFEYLLCLHLKCLPLHTNERKLQIYCELIYNYLKIKSLDS